jgi:hypothetical protein
MACNGGCVELDEKIIAVAGSGDGGYRNRFYGIVYRQGGWFSKGLNQI